MELVRMKTYNNMSIEELQDSITTQKAFFITALLRPCSDEELDIVRSNISEAESALEEKEHEDTFAEFDDIF
jgi:uncharacterized membrane protein affecting hemolysin expression